MIAQAVCHHNACRPYVQKHRCMPCGGSTPRSTTPMTSCWWTLPQSGSRAQTSSRPSRPSLPPPTALLWHMPGRTHLHSVCLSVCLSVCPVGIRHGLSVCHAGFRHCLSVCLSVSHVGCRHSLSVCLCMWTASGALDPSQPGLLILL